MPYRQVCTYRDNLISPVDYAEVIHRIAKTYNDAYCLIENNDIGQQVADVIHDDYEYEGVLQTEHAGRAGKRVSSGFGSSKLKLERGIRTTKSVKNIGCSMLKMLLEQNQLVIIDPYTIDELNKFSRRADSFQAEEGATDDLVMGLVLFGWLSNQDFFKEATDINTMGNLRERSDEEIMSDILPFGIIDNHGFPEHLEPFDNFDHWGVRNEIGEPFDFESNEGF